MTEAGVRSGAQAAVDPADHVILAHLHPSHTGAVAAPDFRREGVATRRSTSTRTRPGSRRRLHPGGLQQAACVGPPRHRRRLRGHGDGVPLWQTRPRIPATSGRVAPSSGLDGRRRLHDRALGREGAAGFLRPRHGPLSAQVPRLGLAGRPATTRACSTPPISTARRSTARAHDAIRAGASSTGVWRRASATRWRGWPSASASRAPRCGRRCSCSSARASCASSATAACACSRRRRTTSRRSSRCACCSRSRPRYRACALLTDDDLAALERELEAMAAARGRGRRERVHGPRQALPRDHPAPRRATAGWPTIVAQTARPRALPRRLDRRAQPRPAGDPRRARRDHRGPARARRRARPRAMRGHLLNTARLLLAQEGGGPHALAWAPLVGVPEPG